MSLTQIFCPQQMLRARGNGETFVSATMSPRLPRPLVISRCCFAEDGKEVYKDLIRTCTAIVLLIEPFV